ncbi:MAG: histidine--tRNA ligase [Chloroflexi bacterium]|nr:histidine--tRNA ligase [Chloroflexota bacterium]|tara:strand:- start:2119 stop:3390 length:1272 start_codon:yes stop_codon:yes gene_type:complete
MFSSIRGTKDILPKDQKYWDYFKNEAFKQSAIYGFERIDTPTFEMTDLFLRGIGIGTDIVTKETYSFIDRGENNITLRPEGTASVCRAYIQNAMYTESQPKKFYYFTSIFRYERPQSGRLREHHQFGIETLGSNDPFLDGEIIQFAWNLLSRLGLNKLNLNLNTIGDQDDRKNYIKSLKNYYTQSDWGDSKCKDCENRIKTNTLRILDCKNKNCQNYINEAPNMLDYASDLTINHFEKVKNYLDLSKIKYTINKSLVRGLDYYTNTVFEITSKENKSQNALVGGGRYNGLIEQLGGPSTPGTGFGMGVERVINEIIESNININEKINSKILFTSIDKNSYDKKIKYNLIARNNNINSEISTEGKSLKATMRYANNNDFSIVIILGQDPNGNNNTVSIKYLESGKQENISENELLTMLNKNNNE